MTYGMLSDPLNSLINFKKSSGLFTVWMLYVLLCRKTCVCRSRTCRVTNLMNQHIRKRKQITVKKYQWCSWGRVWCWHCRNITRSYYIKKIFINSSHFHNLTRTLLCILSGPVNYCKAYAADLNLITFYYHFYDLSYLFQL